MVLEDEWFIIKKLLHLRKIKILERWMEVVVKKVKQSVYKHCDELFWKSCFSCP